MPNFEKPRSVRNIENPEAEHSLPQEPNEAAKWLHEIWERSGGWASQHPLERRVTNSEEFENLSEEERVEWYRIRSEFLWLAEIHRSEMSWDQSYIVNNSSEIFAFSFYNGSYYDEEKPENHPDHVPHVYVYRPYNKEESSICLEKKGEIWLAQSLDKLRKEHREHFDF